MMEQGLSFHFKDSKHIKPTSCNVIEDIFNVWWGRTLSLSNWLHCGGAEGRRGARTGAPPGQAHFKSCAKQLASLAHLGATKTYLKQQWNIVSLKVFTRSETEVFEAESNNIEPDLCLKTKFL